MKRKKHKPLAGEEARIKVRLDYRTVITIRSMEALESWLEKYPNAKVIE